MVSIAWWKQAVTSITSYIKYGYFWDVNKKYVKENEMWHYTLLKSDVTRRDHVSVVMDPMNAGSRIVNFIVNFIRDGTVFA